MSVEPDFRALAALYEEACSLNREALRALRDGAALQTLNGIFERKKRLAEVLGREQEILVRKKTGPEPGASLDRVFQVQREAATLELQLAEALGNAVPSNGNVIAAYKKAVPGHDADGLDQCI
ncbi:MAG TPA: hypothetical protein VK786_05540 [bacterium]|nr:hypothetical protein [bacterium]